MEKLNMGIDELTLRNIVREEMKSALKEVGLHDDDAGADVRDLRVLLRDWRETKRTIWIMVARWGTMIVLGIISLGAWTKINGGGGE
jgi:hypothetical protein